MDIDRFTTSFRDVVLYISHRDPVYAEFLLKTYPLTLPRVDLTRQVRDNKNKWLKLQTEAVGAPVKMPPTIPLEVFTNAAYSLAKNSKNPKRCKKFKLYGDKLGDARSKDLTCNNKK